MSHGQEAWLPGCTVGPVRWTAASRGCSKTGSSWRGRRWMREAKGCGRTPASGSCRTSGPDKTDPFGPGERKSPVGWVFLKWVIPFLTPCLLHQKEYGGAGDLVGMFCHREMEVSNTVACGRALLWVISGVHNGPWPETQLNGCRVRFFGMALCRFAALLFPGMAGLLTLKLGPKWFPGIRGLTTSAPWLYPQIGQRAHTPMENLHSFRQG